MRRRLAVLTARATGASMTEYIIIVALVAIFLIGAVGMYGDKIKSLITGSKDKMSAVENRARGGGSTGGGTRVVDGR